MKKIKLFSLLIAATLLSACSSDLVDEPTQPTPDNDGEIFEVKLNFDGEIADFTESEDPLTRADGTEAKRVYGINVWCMKTDGSQSSYTNYAYGLFDNKDDMVISLLGGYKYRFECYMVEDDKESLFTYTSGSYTYTGNYPFCGKSISNKFSIGSSSSGFKFDSNTITTETSAAKTYSSALNSKKGESYQTNPQIGIFYGLLDNYIPSQNLIATIPIYKLGYYGLRVVVTGVPDGSLYVDPSVEDRIYYWRSSGNTSSDWISWGKTFTEAGSIENLFTGGFYPYTYSNWLNNMQNYSTSTYVSFTWTRANGYRQSFSKSVTLKRNVMTVLTVNLTGGAGEATLGFEEHSEEMTETNDSFDYDGGDMNDIPVDPTE